MKNLQQFPILSTSEFNNSDGTYKPVSAKYWADVNERINYRGSRSPYHITTNHTLRKAQLTQEQRQERYEVLCLERGIRPYNYPENLWLEYLRDRESEEHTERCEAKRAWQYEV